MVGLKKLNLNSLFVSVTLYLLQQIRICLSAVDVRLSDAEHIQIRSVNN